MGRGFLRLRPALDSGGNPVDPAARGSRLRPGPALAALLAASLLVSLAIAEAVVRMRYPVLTPYRDFAPGIYVEDPERGWASLPNYRGTYHSFFEDQAVVTNSLGFRGPEPPADAASADLRVLSLGDSNTFGRGVGETETHPIQLEAELRRRGATAVVWNSGVCGYDTAQALATLRRFGPALRPNVVTLGWLENDLGGSREAGFRVIEGYLVERPEDVALVRERLRGSLWDASYLLRLVDIRLKIHRAHRRMLERRAEPTQPAEALLERNLAEVRDVVREAHALGARPIVIVYVGQESIVHGERTDTVAQVEAALERDGIETVSTYELFRADLEAHERDLFVLRDRGHPNGTGHALTALAVADRLVPLRAASAR